MKCIYVGGDSDYESSGLILQKIEIWAINTYEN